MQAAVSTDGALALLAVIVLSTASVFALAQQPPDESSDINPRVSNCNVTRPRADRQRPGDPIVETPITDSLISPNIPCERVTGVNGPGVTFDIDDLQQAFDFYSWLTFVALNWPADGSEIGSTDKRASWEEFKQIWDVMLDDGSLPPAWGESAAPPEVCRGHRPDGKMLVRMAEETYSQPLKTGPLIDQNGRYVLFTISMNRPMFEYIRRNQLYSVQGQREFKFGTDKFSGATFPDDSARRDPIDKDAAVINFPVGSLHDGSSGTVGSIMIKAAWKILGTKDDRKRLHTVPALIYQPTAEGTAGGRCVEAQLGLVGFHIAHKTFNAHQWIWSTFEHVDNVPLQKDVDSKRVPRSARFNFYDAKCALCRSRINQPPPRPWDPAFQGHGGALKFRDGYKSQITRVVPISEAVAKLNESFTKVLRARKSVWANYMLISTQWPTDFQCFRNSNTRNNADPTCAPFPVFLANTALETYGQGEVPLASSSCISCHGNAVAAQAPSSSKTPASSSPSDFTFILEKAKQATR